MRHKILNRSYDFIERVKSFTFFTDSFMKAFYILFLIGLGVDTAHTVKYSGKNLKFRGQDVGALYEVLYDLEYSFLNDYVRNLKQPLILDVGAHIGTFAIWALNENSEARILGVEANPKTHAIAGENAKEYIDAGLNWHVLHRAAGQSDKAILRLSVAGVSMSDRIDIDGEIEVQAISLVSLLSKLAPDGASADLVKIDIEGSEEVFLFAEPNVLNRINTLVIELHPDLCDIDRVRVLLDKYFDQIVNIEGRNSTKPLLLCTRKS